MRHAKLLPCPNCLPLYVNTRLYLSPQPGANTLMDCTLRILRRIVIVLANTKRIKGLSAGVTGWRQ